MDAAIAWAVHLVPVWVWDAFLIAVAISVVPLALVGSRRQPDAVQVAIWFVGCWLFLRCSHELLGPIHRRLFSPADFVMALVFCRVIVTEVGSMNVARLSSAARWKLVGLIATAVQLMLHVRYPTDPTSKASIVYLFALNATWLVIAAAIGSTGGRVARDAVGSWMAGGARLLRVRAAQ